MASTRNKSSREILSCLACSHGFYAAAYVFRNNKIDPAHKKVLLRFADEVNIDTGSLFVHRGARLTVRFSDWIRDSLLEYDGVDENMIASVEVNKICEDGMTLEQLLTIKDFWESPNKNNVLKHLWPFLENELEHCVDHYWSDVLSHIEAFIRPEMYTIEEVKLGVRFNVISKPIPGGLFSSEDPEDRDY